ncbi:MAG: Zn-ribbon domain-containing OB-fold protein [Firmicutes bacterium]|nr:Zn-ribbon domain-containing OB-fold protein [Bacillota bacterium]
MKKEPEQMIFHALAEVPYAYSVGAEGSRFLAEIRDNKRFVGTRCPKCGKVYAPARKVCGPCFTAMDEWVELPDTGELMAFAVVNMYFIDPKTGEPAIVPYTYGYIKLDGADTTISVLLDELDESKLQRGMKMKAVFNEERVGLLTDIKYFTAV